MGGPLRQRAWNSKLIVLLIIALNFVSRYFDIKILDIYYHRGHII